MHYYKRNVGDYARDAGHLSMIEHGAYTLLLDRIYVSEAGIPADQVHRIVRARSPDEVAAVDAVLAEFFTNVNGVWMNRRAGEVIAEYQARHAEVVEAGRLGGLAKKARARAAAAAEGKPDASDSQADAKDSLSKPSSQPLTTNQKPKTEKKPAREGAPLRTFSSWIASLPADADAVPEDHHAFTYAANAGIPREYVELAWIAFERKYTKGENAKKKYRDWPDVFRNAIEGNWLGLWYIDDSSEAYQLTTAGKQLQRAEQGRK